jgi:excisionase family DNA binding protein
MKQEIKTQKQSLDLVTIQEACKIFSVSRPTIGNWIRRGLLKKIKLLRKVYFRREDLADLVNSQLA